MYAAASIRTVIKPALLLRLFWLVMFAGHLPATLAPLRGEPFEAARLLILLAAEAFFLLKVLDVRWLRVARCPRTRRALAAGFVLLHAQVIERTIAHGPDSPAAWNLVVLGGGLTAAALLPRREPSTEPIAATAEHRRSHDDRLRLLAASFQPFLPSRFLLMARTCLVNRAPPLRAQIVR